jgi:hypothetical protein
LTKWLRGTERFDVSRQWIDGKTGWPIGSEHNRRGRKYHLKVFSNFPKGLQSLLHGASPSTASTYSFSQAVLRPQIQRNIGRKLPIDRLTSQRAAGFVPGKLPLLWRRTYVAGIRDEVTRFVAFGGLSRPSRT